MQAGSLACTQAQAESLPARLVAMSTSAPTSATPILAEDIFEQHFLSVCGSCHGPDVDPPGNGGFQIQTASDFMTAMNATILAHVINSVCPSNPDPTNANDPMPPCSSPNGATYSMRDVYKRQVLGRASRARIELGQVDQRRGDVRDQRRARQPAADARAVDLE